MKETEPRRTQRPDALLFFCTPQEAPAHWTADWHSPPSPLLSEMGPPCCAAQSPLKDPDPQGAGVDAGTQTFQPRLWGLPAFGAGTSPESLPRPDRQSEPMTPVCREQRIAPIQLGTIPDPRLPHRSSPLTCPAPSCIPTQHLKELPRCKSLP